MSNTPAGWYPQADGQQRYWDGAQWTEHFAPGTAQQSAPTAAAAAGARPWFKKKRFIIPGALVGLLFIGSLGANGSESDASLRASAASASPSTTADRTSTPTAKPTTATPTPTPTPSATPKATPAAPKPKPTPKPPAVQTLSSRAWSKIVKDPDRYAGKRYYVYGEIFQFDAATGEDTFLANVAHKNTTSYGFFDGENTMMTGNAGKLEDLVEGDVFKATVTVLGSFSYDTQIGGNTTVPHLQIEKIKRIGNNS